MVYTYTKNEKRILWAMAIPIALADIAAWVYVGLVAYSCTIGSNIRP